MGLVYYVEFYCFCILFCVQVYQVSICSQFVGWDLYGFVGQAIFVFEEVDYVAIKISNDQYSWRVVIEVEVNIQLIVYSDWVWEDVYSSFWQCDIIVGGSQCDV